MESKDSIKLSVRDFVTFVLQNGDLGTGFAGSSRMTEGIKGHQAVQKAGGEEYTPEVPVFYTIEKEGIRMEISGRIDGIISTEDGITIDEIKTTSADIDAIDENYNPLHFAQAKCYAFIFSDQNELETIDVQVTYYQIETKVTKAFLKSFSIEELQLFFNDLVDRYIEWAQVVRKWWEVRDASIKGLDFPYSSYRKGQREMAVGVYKTIRNKQKLFAQAPTGTGKTIAALFPAVKALGEGLTSKIFYLTAKTTTRNVAENAFNMMRERGLKFKTLTLTAKEKLCITPGASCNPALCEYACGYYDRIKTAVEDIFQQDSFTRNVIEDYARKHRVCPFEFSLDLSLWCDCIICDYNYVFDPRVYLKRFFMEGGGDYSFLIDEAHNMVDRCRDMFSAGISKKPVLELKRMVKGLAPDVYGCLNDINAYMIKARKACEEDRQGFIVRSEGPEELYPLLRDFIKVSEDYLSKNGDSELRQKLLELYFDANTFLRIREYYDESYASYFEKNGSDVKIKLFCLDPSGIMKKLLKRGKAAVFFSATLNPMDYFVNILGGDEDSGKLKFPSPFPPENLCVMVDDRTSTKYRVRELTYEKVAGNIAILAKGRTGNYIAYFPSYKYMDEVSQRFLEKNPDINTVIQNPGMTETEREEFLSRFTPDKKKTLVGFAVVGGVFGEGIDLTGESLSGVVIVGVGLPQICFERDMIKDYFDRVNGRGFEYSYIYPGMNKVMQAVGRVIRTEQDRGVALLVDERFSYPVYARLLPAHWNPARVKNIDGISRTVERFWR